MEPEAVIFIGIQATGKSSFYFERFASTHLRINLDMLHTRNRERILVEACIEAKQSFVIDNTNPTVSDRRRYLEPAIANKFTPIAYYFQSKIEDAIRRNASRDSKEYVPEIGIRGTYTKLEMPSLQEGFKELFYVSMDEKGQLKAESWNHEI